jgi:hypothetical protein
MGEQDDMREAIKNIKTIGTSVGFDLFIYELVKYILGMDEGINAYFLGSCYPSPFDEASKAHLPISCG